jgi:hypothetical protein
MRGQPIPIIADVPTSDPQLGFAEYADALCDAICGGVPPQFTVGIYGAWGSGKTSLLKAIEARLDQDGTTVVVYFDAWRHERSDVIVVPLLHAVYRALEKSSAQTATAAVKRAMGALIDSLTLQIGAAGVSLKELRRGLRGGADLASLDAVFAKPFSELQGVGAALQGRRVVVLIDDLDRCSPGKVVTLLEALNLVLDIRGFIFVLALDYDVLTQAVHERFPYANGDVFIEKMVQVPFRVPRLNLDSDRALADLVAEWPACVAQLPKEFPTLAKDIARLALDSNPRQIKRLINSALVLNRIVGASLKSDANVFSLLMALIGLQLAWPDRYRSFADEVFANDAETIRMYVGEDDDARLQRYARHLLADDLRLESVRHVLQFTETVVASSQETGSATRPSEASPRVLSSRFDRNKERLMSALLIAGFRLGPRTSTSYYSASYPGLRFKVTAQRLRLEARERGVGRPWQLRESFSIVSDLDQALAAVTDPRATWDRVSTVSPGRG